MTAHMAWFLNFRVIPLRGLNFGKLVQIFIFILDEKLWLTEREMSDEGDVTVIFKDSNRG